jgi:hypothetical protein
MEAHEMTQAFKAALTEFHGEQTGGDTAFTIPRKQHYEDHTFIQVVREVLGITRKTAWKAAVTLFITGLATIMVTGTVAIIVLKAKGIM